MPMFRLLADHYIAGALLLADSIQTTADVGGVLPTNWRPSNNSEPLDGPALTLFYNAGPQVPGLIREQWSVTGVIKPPITRWQGTSMGTTTNWSLTGLGVGLPAISN